MQLDTWDEPWQLVRSILANFIFYFSRSRLVDKVSNKCSWRLFWLFINPLYFHLLCLVALRDTKQCPLPFVCITCVLRSHTCPWDLVVFVLVLVKNLIEFFYSVFFKFLTSIESGKSTTQANGDLVGFVTVDKFIAHRVFFVKMRFTLKRKSND